MRLREPKDLQLHFGAAEQIHGAVPDIIAAERVLEEMHLYAGVRALDEGGGELVGNPAFFKEEILKGDRRSRGADAFQHGGKNFVAILERGDFVARQQRRAQHLPNRPNEGIVTHAVVGMNAMADLLFVREEIPRHEERRETTRHRGPEQLWPDGRAAFERGLHVMLSRRETERFPKAHICGKLRV